MGGKAKHLNILRRSSKVYIYSAELRRNYPPLSRSHSGEDAPLHSLRGPSTGEIRPKSDSNTVLGRSRLQGLDRGDGEEEDEEGVGEGEAEVEVQQEEEL